MRKITSLLSVLVLSFLPIIPLSSYAAGDFDGIWETSAFEFASITQNGDSMVAVRLVPNNLEWEAFQGDLVGNTATLTTVVSEVTATIRFEFSSTTSGVVTVISCAPLNECEYLPGTQFTAVKIF